jgi:hypothetical protein
MFIPVLVAGLFLSSCEESSSNNPPLSDLLGVWEIANINHRECDELGCVSEVMDFSGTGLTFELSGSSASYFPDVNNPSTIISYSVEGYDNNILRLKDNEGTWDFEVSDYGSAMVTITAEFPSGVPEEVSYDVIFLER